MCCGLMLIAKLCGELSKSIQLEIVDLEKHSFTELKALAEKRSLTELKA
jgi:hypothetical protein